MRDAFSHALVAAARKDPKVLLLTGDHGYALFDTFRKACPDQYLNCGIAEQNMVGVAAGLAKAGFRPIVYGLAAFVPIRVLEQIKIDVCYEELPVTFIGDGAGVVYAQLGTSHQSTEDLAALRAIPHISIYSPCDRFELTACAEDILRNSRPAYLRMGKADLGDVHGGMPVDWTNGDLIPITNTGAPYLFVGTGSGVKLAQNVANAVGNADVVSVPCLKPFPALSLHRLAARREAIVTFEEHSIYGGLGGAVAETLIGRFAGTFVRVGVKDQFSTLCGNYSFVMESHGLTPQVVEAQIRKALDASVQCQE
ncbi:transketolase family protein [Paraburkholderia phenoliruptrix]|uniref:Transketolase n=2 Tax=Paraburkholderia phenoliruptrix TaxID=252970 RepID=K0DJ64_9BURK|nr:transketolase C-terminal domain-containing protein [Paraburkholderia phenoliruptrix]AFT84795.1 transketolase [Paraburkholderia phenoliruptrix BR3459a]CAB4050513.1 Apulose-4-phosphate transketolase subunit B [Paraburkholderia phenoliruptrix]